MVQLLRFGVPTSESASAGGTVFDGSYLRLGSNSNDESDLAQADRRGVLLNTSGYYNLKVAEAAHEAYGDAKSIVVSANGYSYTSTDSDLTVSLTSGSSSLEANSISITSTQETPDDDSYTTITARAGWDSENEKATKDIIYKNNLYWKKTTEHKDKTVDGSKTKINYLFVLKLHLSLGLHAYSATKFSIKTIDYKATLTSAGVYGLKFSTGIQGQSYKYSGTTSVSLIDAKKVELDEEFCVVKSESRLIRMKAGGLALNLAIAFSGVLEDADGKLDKEAADILFAANEYEL